MSWCMIPSWRKAWQQVVEAIVALLDPPVLPTPEEDPICEMTRMTSCLVSLVIWKAPNCGLNFMSLAPKWLSPKLGGELRVDSFLIHYGWFHIWWWCSMVPFTKYTHMYYIILGVISKWNFPKCNSVWILTIKKNLILDEKSFKLQILKWTSVFSTLGLPIYYIQG